MFLDRKRIILIILIAAGVISVGLWGYHGWKGEQEALTIVDNNENANEEEQQRTTEIQVHVCGEVKLPGVYEMKEGDRVIDAIKQAGGETEDAGLDAINLAAPLYDGQQVIVPAKNATNNAVSGSQVTGQANNNSKVNINTADVQQFETLDGIGETLAQRIIDYRNAHGPFRKLDDLKNVGGIGEKKFENIQEQITLY